MSLDWYWDRKTQHVRVSRLFGFGSCMPYSGHYHHFEPILSSRIGRLTYKWRYSKVSFRFMVFFFQNSKLYSNSQIKSQSHICFSLSSQLRISFKSYFINVHPVSVAFCIATEANATTRSQLKVHSSLAEYYCRAIELFFIEIASLPIILHYCP